MISRRHTRLPAQVAVLAAFLVFLLIGNPVNANYFDAPQQDGTNLGNTGAASDAPATSDSLSTTFCAGNLLLNPSFETVSYGVPSNWTHSGGGSIGVVSAYSPPNGMYVGYVWTKPSGTPARMYQAVNVTPGNTYGMTFYSGTHTPSVQPTIAIRFYNSSGVEIGTPAVHTITKDIDNSTLGGPYTLSATAPTGATSLRVIFTDPSASGNGAGAKGDALCLLNTSSDYGDLPDTATGTSVGNYQTSLSDNGPRHTIVSGKRLGAAIDAETNGQPNSTATGDDSAGATPDDEDGVTIPTLVAGSNATFVINASATGKVNAFFDWNRDGDFADTNEAQTQLSVVAGNNNLVVAVPATAVTGNSLGARFRFSTAGGLSSTGAAADGEVEDYLVQVTPGTASIGDRVWYDTNTNTQQDDGATGINGVTVNLYNGVCGPTGGVIQSKVTSGDGGYLFTNVAYNQSYCVAVVTSTLPAGYTSTTNNNPKTVALTSAGDLTVDFGYVTPATNVPHLNVEKEAVSNACELVDIKLSVIGAGDPLLQGQPLDVMIVFDRSGSMDDAGGNPLQPIQDAKDAAKLLVDQLNPAVDKVGLVSYADTATLNSGLTSSFSTVKTAINGLVANGYTNIGDGVWKAQQELAANGRATAVPVIVVLSDGVANRSHSGASCAIEPTSPTTCTNDAINQAATAKTAGSLLFTIGLNLDNIGTTVGASVETLARDVLQSMASESTNYYEAPDSTDLNGIFSDIAQKVTSIAGSSVVITEVLPIGLQYLPGSAVPTPTSVNGQVLTWNFGVVSIGQTRSATFSATVSTPGNGILVDVYPDTKVVYVDHQSQVTTIPFPETRANIASCSTSSIGDRVWYDTNNNTQQDDGATGINGVTVNLYSGACGPTGGVIRTMVTSEDGNYLFDELAAGTYCVDLDQSTLPPNHLQTNGAVVSDPKTVVLGVNQAILDVDFGFWSPNPDYTITKVNNTDPYLVGVRKGETISFTIRIANIGNVPIVVLPLRDTYVDGVLTYIGATPMLDTPNPGQLDWNDLTSSLASGFGVDLAVGESFDVIVEFVGRMDTTGLPDGVTINTATVRNAYYDPDGPGGTPPQPLPDKSATAPAKIVAPTSVLLADSSLVYQPSGAQISWRTVSEANTIGFYLYRSVDGGQMERITDQMIVAQIAGQGEGTLYQYTDSGIVSGHSYTYELEVLSADGVSDRIPLGTILAGPRIFLPAVQR